MTTTTAAIEQLAINTIRTLSMDAVQAANSGHPGTPMALAPVTYALWQRQLCFDPDDPLWPARDRFVLSCGHASMLLYSMLHLTGVKQLDVAGNPTGELAVPLDHIRNFRQWNSRCPGHPEYRHTSGVETTTGPLGQGVGNSVGMAIAQRWIAARFSQPGFESLFDWRVWALASDGDLMEGIGCEAASLAGHLRLSNLCWIYDDNRITIEGETSLAFSEDVAARFESYGWQIVRVDDVNELDNMGRALDAAAADNDRPTLIVVRTQIGYGAPNKQDTAAAHGNPLGDDEIVAAKANYGWDTEAKFHVPSDVPAHFDEIFADRGRKRHAEWNEKFAEYTAAHPELARAWNTMQQGELPDGWDADVPEFPADEKGMASRASAGKALCGVAKGVPWLLGGSADLAPSTKTLIDGEGSFSADTPAGRNLHFGVREHAMAAIVNGMTLTNLRGYGATFFVFTDYCRPSLRLAAMMEIPAIFVFTHDSIGVGEDGPTHQPIEHLAALRAIPGMVVLRPGDANEAAAAWRTTMTLSDQPVSLVLSRQNLPTLDRSKYASAEGTARGAYVLADAADGSPDVILIGTGSELSLAVAAYEQLAGEGEKVRLVSMPSWELFENQDAAYRESVLPVAVTRRVAVEAGGRFGWERYLGADGEFVGMAGFGASAPYAKLMEEFGITVDRIVEAARK